MLEQRTSSLCNDSLHRFRLKSDIINYKQITLLNNYPNSPKYLQYVRGQKVHQKHLSTEVYTTSNSTISTNIYLHAMPQENYNQRSKSCLKIYGGMPRIMASIRNSNVKGVNILYILYGSIVYAYGYGYSLIILYGYTYSTYAILVL